MSNVLHKKVLVLNANWAPIGFCSVQTALQDMNSSKTPKLAIKVEYYKDDNGSYHFDMPIEMIPLRWDEWVELSPREVDVGKIRTSKLEIRVPTVLIAPKYKKIPFKKFRPTKSNLGDHYNYQCYYSGRKLSPKEMNVEHVISRDEWRRRGLPGSPNTWQNLAPCDVKLNHKKSNLTLKEFEEKFGYKPQYKLSEPPPVAIAINSGMMDENSDWKFFIK